MFGFVSLLLFLPKKALLLYELWEEGYKVLCYFQTSWTHSFLGISVWLIYKSCTDERAHFLPNFQANVWVFKYILLPGSRLHCTSRFHCKAQLLFILGLRNGVKPVCVLEPLQCLQVTHCFPFAVSHLVHIASFFFFFTIIPLVFYIFVHTYILGKSTWEFLFFVNFYWVAFTSREIFSFLNISASCSDGGDWMSAVLRKQHCSRWDRDLDTLRSLAIQFFLLTNASE